MNGFIVFMTNTDIKNGAPLVVKYIFMT